ncbi:MULTISPECIES: DUF6718 family protein [unclassified Jeotgalibaca]|uniref:DUF6718 family protein n=1 Tax=unclassified Jeotgalibaca TaxID=2621505 RepID=UPI003FD5DF7F
MGNKYLVAKTFKKKGSAAISLRDVTDFLNYIPQLEGVFKRSAEFLIVSCDEGAKLDDAWPEYAPIQVENTKEAFEKAVQEKTTR